MSATCTKIQAVKSACAIELIGDTVMKAWPKLRRRKEVATRQICKQPESYSKIGLTLVPFLCFPQIYTETSASPNILNDPLSTLTGNKNSSLLNPLVSQSLVAATKTKVHVWFGYKPRRA